MKIKDIARNGIVVTHNGDPVVIVSERGIFESEGYKADTESCFVSEEILKLANVRVACTKQIMECTQRIYDLCMGMDGDGTGGFAALNISEMLLCIGIRDRFRKQEMECRKRLDA